MKRDIFRRGTRMTHRFGECENDEPFMPLATFDPKFPTGVTARRGSPPLNIQTHGEHRYTPIMSPVVKPGGGVASLNGPAPDEVDRVEMAIPANTKKRTTFRP